MTSTALVTGATGGIGREIARQLAASGWTVHVGARDLERGEAAAQDVGGQALLLDVTDPVTIAAAAAQLSELDVLVNNAGISLDTGSVDQADVEMFRRTYETNVFGVVAVTNAFLPLLRRSPHPRIVNISSGTGSLTWSTEPNPQFNHRAAAGGLAAYRSSKTALNALTVFYAQTLESDGVKVNALAPGLRATNLNERAAAAGGDPAEAAAGAVRLALLPDDGPTGLLWSWDGTVAPW
jgi:NAD(P)-dependent dehydrogenase (short-subunit alcohol dehydrogenase family)